MGRKVKIVVDVTELGRKGGRARAEALSPEERRASARKAIQARWDRYYAEHPEKKKTARPASSRKSPNKKTR
jgi:hypothetical protein